MLQTNPSRRPSSDEILKKDFVIKKQNLIRNDVNNKDNHNNDPPVKLLATIKLPRNMNEINQRLPKKKMYSKEK
jgi:hypothetical protein